MKYKALIDIGDYKEGEEVPEDKAKLWMKMYKVFPVEKVGEESSVPEKPVQKEEDLNKEEPEVPEDVEPTPGEEESKEESNDSILEDYLARGVNVVKKNVSEDNLSKEQLEKLVELEKDGKNRKKVIKAIKERLKEE